jgi:hypothetical protein
MGIQIQVFVQYPLHTRRNRLAERGAGVLEGKAETPLQFLGMRPFTSVPADSRTTESTKIFLGAYVFARMRHTLQSKTCARRNHNTCRRVFHRCLPRRATQGRMDGESLARVLLTKIRSVVLRRIHGQTHLPLAAPLKGRDLMRARLSQPNSIFHSPLCQQGMYTHPIY